MIASDKDKKEKPAKKSGISLWKILGIIAFLIFFFYVLDWGFIKGTITAYGIQCPKDFEEGNGCYTLGATTTYYPDKKSQTVKTKNEYGIDTLNNCTVINRKNWQCTFNDGTGDFGFNNGEYHTDLWIGWSDEDEYGLEFDYVSRLRFLLEDWSII